MMTWVVIAILVIGLIALAWGLLRGHSSSQTRVSPFTADAHNDKVVLVQGWEETEIRKIIDDFVGNYESDGYPSYTIEPHKQSDKLFRLQFPNDIHPLLFTFLVNFIAYPFNLDLTNRHIVVAGTTTLTDGYDGLDKSLIGRKALLYLPENDEDHTIVYMQFADGTTYANSFHDLVWQRITEPRLSSEVTSLVGPG